MKVENVEVDEPEGGWLLEVTGSMIRLHINNRQNHYTQYFYTPMHVHYIRGTPFRVVMLFEVLSGFDVTYYNKRGGRRLHVTGFADVEYLSKAMDR